MWHRDPYGMNIADRYMKIVLFTVHVMYRREHCSMTDLLFQHCDYFFQFIHIVDLCVTILQNELVVARSVWQKSIRTLYTQTRVTPYAQDTLCGCFVVNILV